MSFFDIISAASLVVSTAAAIAAMTPSKKDDKIFGKIQGLINLLALNVRHAKNKD